MKKILLVAADGFSKTGVPSVFMNIVRNLSKYGFVFDIIYFDEEYKYYYDEFVSFGGRAFLFNKQHKSIFFRKLSRYLKGKSYFRNCSKVIKEYGPYDAIHCFKEYMSCYFLRAALENGIRNRIYHCNNIIKIGGNPLNRFLMKKERKDCLKYMNKLIGCSKEACLSAFGTDAPYLVINNPYNESAYFFNTSLQSEKIELVQTAGFCSNKNQMFSLDVAYSIKCQRSDVMLHLIGMDIDNNYKRLLSKKIVDLGMEKNVSFHNFDCDQKVVFDKCSYFLFPSKSEAFGISLIEAQACGLKCFASDTTPEETNVGGCIRLPLSLGPQKWAELLLNDFSNNHEKHQYDCSKYTNKNIIPEYLQLYIADDID